MKEDTRYFELIADRAQELRSKTRGTEAEILRRIRREKIAAGVPLPPTDLSRLARHLGVIEVRQVPLPMNGRLVLEHDGIAVEINRDLSEFKKRYTTAHELAHLIVENKRLSTYTLLSGNTRRQASSPYSLVEKLCDLGAQEILLPGQWLRDQLRNHIPSLNLAAEISKDVDCTIDFLAKRAVGLGLWDCQLLWCERRAGKVIVTNTFRGKDESSLSSIEHLDFDGSLAGKCLTLGRFLEEDINLRICDEDHMYRAQGVPLSENLALLMLIYTR